MKKRLERLLTQKNEQRNALYTSMIECENKEERAAIGETLAALESEIAEVTAMLADIDEPATEPDGARSATPLATMTMSTAPATAQRSENPTDTPEYRQAFMNFCRTGAPIPKELRATTDTTDASAAIPTVLVNEIIKELKSYGNLYAAVRKLNIQGGVEFPILTLKPSASWIADGAASTAQKIKADDKVSFSYHGLECKIAQTLIASVTTIDAFQELFTELAVEAIAQALDIAIIAGTGSGQPVGVTVDSRVPNANKITLTPAEFSSWEMWKKKVFAKIPKSYQKGVFVMAQGTFDGYIDGMVDTVGQPIARVNYGIADSPAYRFGGKTVETVESDVISDYDNASTGDVVAVFFNPTDYAINSNMELKTVKWVDNDSNEVKNKVILVCDGKLLDPNGVILVKKGAAN